MLPTVAIHCAYTSLRPPSELRPNPENPNQHSAHQIQLLALIIGERGWRSPITVSKRSGLVVRGHGRLEAAILMGCEVVPIDEQDYASEADELADLLADNRLAELAELDPDGIKALLTRLSEIDPTYNRELAGYGEDEIAKLFEEEPAVEEELTIPDMELQAFEHHDYLMFVFDDQRDFMRALQIAAIGKVNFSISRSSARIGLGRVVPGRRFIELVAPRLPASTAPELPPEPEGEALAQPRAKATTQSPRARK